MNLWRIELRLHPLLSPPPYQKTGEEIRIRIEGAEGSAGRDGIVLSAVREDADGGTIVRVAIANRSDAPVILDSAWFEIVTGFSPSARARFFKHGYQSWSASGAAPVSTSSHRRDTAPFLVKLNRQSEVERPDGAPESQTSELFTIVEASGRAERVLAGFIGGASQLTTMVSPSPDLIRAHAMLDGVVLALGETREIEPLYFASSDESTARLASRWASLIGARMNARIDAPYQRGWCSWYHYFHAISEDAMRTNLRSLAAMRSEFPIEVVQLDDGFQAALGDWDATNPKFPSGLKVLASEIREAGFRPGLWTAPFLASPESRIMREHPDWFIRHHSGEPLRAGYNTNWTSGRDAFAYALDPSNPEFRAHLERLFAKLARDFGYSYLKLDFLYAGAAEGARSATRLTRAEALRAGLDAIRRGAGDDAFILGCGCPIGPAIGAVDGMRIGPDVAPFWGESTGRGAGLPATAAALDAIVARSFMHRRLWLNDPDCLMLRARETRLTAEERGALAAAIAGCGGMLLISDDMRLLGRDASAAYRAAAAMGAEMDSQSDREPVLALDQMASGSMRALVKRLTDGAIAILINLGETAERIRLFDLRLGVGRMTLRDISGTERSLGDAIEIPPHAARILRLRS